MLVSIKDGDFDVDDCPLEKRPKNFQDTEFGASAETKPSLGNNIEFKLCD